MSATPGFQFRRLLRAMDAESFERFVADLWRARGWTVERDGGTLVVDHPTLDDRRTLEVRAVPWWRPRAPSHAPADADVAVVNRPVADDSSSVLDAEDLRDMVRYAVDPETRARLFDSHLDRSGSPTGLAIQGVPPVTPARLAIAIVALAVVFATGATGVAILPGEPSAPGPEASNDEVASPDVEIDLDGPAGFAATRWPGSGGGYPPGLDADGITDPAALASAHARRASDRSYALDLTVREFEYGVLAGSYRERVAVRSNWTFASSIDTVGELRSRHPVVSGVELYSDGNGLFVHVEPARSVDRQAALQASPGDRAGLENRIERYLAAALSVNDSTVDETTQIGETTFRRVHGTDVRPDGSTETVTALVTADGTIYEVRTERGVPGTDRTVVVTLEYTYGPVEVDRPAWVENRSVTAGRNLPISKR